MWFSLDMAAAKCVALLLVVLAVGGTHAVDYMVTNSVESSDGGKRFDNEIGRNNALQIMDDATQFIWQTFAEQSSADRKNVQTIALFVESISDSGIIAYTSNDKIHLRAEYVASFEGDVKTEITGILYHEVTHSWQWNGNGNAPSGLIEGIADYIRLAAGFASPTWPQPGGGNKWDDGYTVTAYFLQYCDTVTSGFVQKMNSKMRDGWDLGFFNDITGKSVDELWSDYKAKYGN